MAATNPGWLALGTAATILACSGPAPTTRSTSGGPGTTPHASIGDGEIPGEGASGATGDDAGSALYLGGGSGGGSAGGLAAPPPAAPPDVSGGGASGSSAAPTGGGPGGDGGIPAGLLTAGAWDDNRNFDLFLPYRAQEQSLPGAPPISEQEHRDAFAVWSRAQPAKTTLDVSLVIDTTGSMGDEMDYLRSEFLAIHAAIESKYAGADQRWSLIVYKDVVDTYIVRWFNFRTDPNDFVSHMAAQTAGGGGDYPESPERALATAAQLDWRGDSTAKLAFWVTDAPHHDKDAAAMADALRALRGVGVHLYPVAASGADDLTELTMRAGAELTGGRFLFLTDDSGIGDTHAVPRVPCFFVTKLDKAMLRMVDIEMTGQYREPDAADIIRTGGDPQSGRCTLSSGVVATIF